MKTSEWKRIVRGSVPAGSEWAFRQNLCYSVPVKSILFGVTMGTARDPAFIYIVRIALPLFVPTADVHGGERVRGSSGQHISVATEDVGGLVASVLLAGYSESTELEKLVQRGRDIGNLTQSECGAYASILLGDAAGAITMLRAALERDRGSDDLREFVGRTRDRMHLILATLEESGLESAMR